MAISLHTNIASQFANRYMGNAQNSVRTQIERLSSGLRTNSAADDAAGLSISSRMTSQIRAAEPLSRGINDGISLLQVAGGGIRGTLDSLQRARELSVQAGNSPLSTTDREALDFEYQQMMAQVNHISNTTEIFGVFPLKGKLNSGQNQPSGPLGSTPHITDIFPTSGYSVIGRDSGVVPIAYIPKGATDITIEIDCLGWDDDIQIFTADGKHLVGTPLSDTTWKDYFSNDLSDFDSEILKDEYGFKATATYNSSDLINGSDKFEIDIKTNPSNALIGDISGMHFTYSGDWDYHDGSFNDGIVEEFDIASGVYKPENLKERVHIDETTEPLIIIITGKGQFDATVSWGTMPPKDTPPNPVDPNPPLPSTSRDGIRILTNATPGTAATFVTIDKTPTDTEILGLVGSALNPLDKVLLAIKALDAAINKVSSYAAKHGAIESGLDQAISNVRLSSDITSAARSRIMDADFATETAQLTAKMILSSAGAAMSAQANLTPKLVLALLGD